VLPAGKYSLQLAIGDYNHVPIDRSNSDENYDPIVSKIIRIEIKP